jgi:hypothetical protein
MSLRTRERCFQGLVKICGEYGIIPNSYIIPESKIEKAGDSPISSGGFSEVWEGVHRGEPVAIKTIRYYQVDDVQKIQKVGSFHLFPSSRPSLTIYRTFAERS